MEKLLFEERQLFGAGGQSLRLDSGRQDCYNVPGSVKGTC